MPNLSNEYLNKLQYLSEGETASQVAAFDEAPTAIGGIPIRLLMDRSSRVTVMIGWRAIVMMILVPVIYTFAGETFNQWFYLLAGGVLSALFLSFFLPLLQLLDLNATCVVPASTVHNESVPIKVMLTRNRILGPLSSRFPVKWLVVRCNLANHLGKAQAVKPLIIDAMDGESWIYATTPPLKRGIYRFESLDLLSSYPFGLFWFCRRIESAASLTNNTGTAKPIITVYPKLEVVEGNFLYKIRSNTDSPMGLIATKTLSHTSSSSVRGLREFVHGDSPRLIHWPSSARTGRLMVREYEAEGLPGFDLLLNMTASWQTEDQFELAVSVIFSLLHLGYTIGGAPELYLVPNLDIEPSYLPGFMADMPAIPSGLARSSHLLARVMHVSDCGADFKVVDLQENSHMALLTVRPAKQFDPDGRAKEDDSIKYKVELAVIPRSADMAGGAKDAADVHMPVHELGIVNRRGAGNPTGRVIATISQIEEVARL